LFLGFLGGTPQFSQERTRIAGSARKVVLMAGFDLFLQRFILLVEVILQIIDVHDTNHWDAVFFEDEILAIDVSPPDDLPKVDTRFRQRDTMHNAFHDFGTRRFGFHY
jgi:hypothetical protein